jgi:DNA repair exonuclease SbcCD ATPase subunit
MTEVVAEQKTQKTAMVPFGTRNANRERIETEEAELKRLMEGSDKKKEETEEGDDSLLNAEEKSFKKRYGDLRRHSQQQQTTFQKQIDELKEQLTKSTEKQIKLPTSESDLAEWAKTYPDVAKIVETIAIKKAKEQSLAIEDRLNKLDEREKLTAREKAELELNRLHPDFDKIRDTDEFHTWAEEQPSWIQQALYENDNDARSAARAIDLYKADMGLTKAKKPKEDTSAAQGVGTRSSKSAPSDNDTDGVIYESEVAKLTSKQYEHHQEDIAKAMRSGKFVYDLSGKAR